MGEAAEGQRQFWPKLRPWLFLALLFALTVFTLSRPAGMPRLAEDAQQDVLDDYRMQFEQQLAREEPELPEGERRLRSAGAAREYQGTAAFRSVVEQRITEYKDTFSDRDGKPYLLHNDPYHFLRQARNLERYGIVGTTSYHSTTFARPKHWDRAPPDWMSLAEMAVAHRQNPGRFIRSENRIPAIPLHEVRDRIKNAPDGENAAASLLPTLLAWMAGRSSLEQAAYWYPVFIGTLTIIMVFSLIRVLSSDYGAFFGTLFFSIHSAFFASGEAGYADTNILILAHMALLVLIAMVLLRTARAWVAMLCAALLGGTLLSLAFTWSGYVTMVVVFGCFLGIILARTLLRCWHYGMLWKLAMVALAGSGVLLLIAVLRGDMVIRALAYLGFGNLPNTLLQNPYELIGELGIFKLAILFRVLGGIPMLIIIGVSLIYLLLRLRQRGSSRLADCFLLCWLGVFTLTAFRIKFFVFFLLPLAVLVGMAIGDYLKLLPEAIAVRWHGGFFASPGRTRALLSVLLCILMIMLFVPNLGAEMRAAVPLMNDALARTGEKLMQEAAPDAILNAWWDSGYLWEAMAERPTLSDGAQPGNMKSYWLSQVYLATDPKETRDILRLLDCGGENVLQTIPKPTALLRRALLLQILRTDNRTARDTLMEQSGMVPIARNIRHLSQGHWIPTLLQRTHCQPREAYLMLSEDLLKKLWVFESYAHSRLDGMAPAFQQRYAATPWQCNRIAGTLHCGAFTVDLPTMVAKTTDGKNLTVLTESNGAVRKGLQKPEGATLMLYRDAVTGGYFAVELKPDFFDTMLGRLYFFGNAGLEEYVEPFSDFSGPYSGRVVTYRIKWDAE